MGGQKAERNYTDARYPVVKANNARDNPRLPWRGFGLSLHAASIDENPNISYYSATNYSLGDHRDTPLLTTHVKHQIIAHRKAQTTGIPTYRDRKGTRSVGS